MGTPYTKVISSLRRAEKFLCGHQDPDGAWRDFNLTPGCSDAWITAVVGTALTAVPRSQQSLNNVLQAANWLHHQRRDCGWGYNGNTATDADSTSWTLLFLGSISCLQGLDPIAMIAPWVGLDGGITTFCGSQFGHWSDEHPEVTAISARMLLNVAGPCQLASQLLRRICSTQQQSGTWSAYWWFDSAYSTAQSLWTLACADLIAAINYNASLNWLNSAYSHFGTTFMLSNFLLASTALHCETVYMNCLRQLLSLQLADGGWPGSPVLLVPDQAGRKPLGDAIPDKRRLLSSALALYAIKCAVFSKFLVPGSGPIST